jgi:hypothetical protein
LAQLKKAGRHVEHLQRRLEPIQNENSQAQQRAVTQQTRANMRVQQLAQGLQIPISKRKPRPPKT